jgi:hypothetical protein
MAALVNVVNMQSDIIREQNLKIAVVEESRNTGASAGNHRRRASPEPSPRGRERSVTRSRSPRPHVHRIQRRTPSLRRYGHRGTERNYYSPPPRHHRRHSLDSDEVRYVGPLTGKIMRVPVPAGLEKPPTMDTYDGTTDPNDYIGNIEVAFNYRAVRGSIKCRLFSTTLREGTLTWYRVCQQNLSALGINFAEHSRRNILLRGSIPRR